MTTNYKRGRAFEYRVRDALYARGAVYVSRSAGSHTKVDLTAHWPMASLNGRPRPAWFVQCKRDGRLPAPERAAIVDIAKQTGNEAILAAAGPKGRGIEFEFLYP